MMGLFRKGERGMKLKVITGLVLTLFLIGMLTLAFNIQTVKAEPTTWTVDDDGPADFSSIQEAIDSPLVMDGDTIYVYDGIYYENVVVSKELSLVGEDNTTTVIDGMEIGTVVVIAADNVMIGEFTIRGSRKPSMEYTPSTDTGVLVFAGYDQTVENATIFNNDIRNNYIGIFIWCSLNNTVVDNRIENNFIGIGIDEAIHNNILRNTLSSNVGGIWLGSGGNDISGNNISSNSEYGMQLDGSLHNTVDRNVIENNGYGIDLSSSSNNIISGNNITANNERGIYLDESSNNKIYHNNFIDNTNQTFVQDAYTNIWDDGYPSGGNYWSDHVCTGNPSDGSQPYIIDANNIDHYPFQDPNGWLLPPPEYTFDVIVDDIHYPVSILSNSAVSNFNFNETEMQISFDVTGESGTTGYCNVTIPKSLLTGSPWIIKIDNTPITDFDEKTNDTHTFLYSTYTHESPLQVTIEGTWVVPEFPSAIILPLLMILSLTTAVFVKLKKKK